MTEQEMLREVQRRMHDDLMFHARVSFAVAVMRQTLLPDRRLDDAEVHLVVTAAAWGLYAAEINPMQPLET